MTRGESSFPSGVFAHRCSDLIHRGRASGRTDAARRPICRPALPRQRPEDSYGTSTVVFTTTHRINFSELDPHNHVGTGRYATYYVDHRMEGLRDRLGWDLKTLASMPFMVWVRRIEVCGCRVA